jgi:hypothetical protein
MWDHRSHHEGLLGDLGEVVAGVQSLRQNTP